MRMKLVSIDVHMSLEARQIPAELNPQKDDVHYSVVNCTPQEAFAMISMPALAGLVRHMVPNYELSEMPEEGD